MGFAGKLKGFGKTVIKTTYEESGAQKVKKDVMQTAHDAMNSAKKMDRSFFGGEGLRHNVQKVRHMLKDVGADKPKPEQPKSTNFKPKQPETRTLKSKK